MSKAKIGLAAGILVALTAYGAAQEGATVKVTVVVPSKLDSFTDRQLEVLLFEFDPRIADKGATQLDKYLKPFKHETGKDTTQKIILGEKAKVNPQMRYYITAFVVDAAGKRTHIAEKDGKSGLCNVLTNGNPNMVTMIARPVR